MDRFDRMLLDWFNYYDRGRPVIVQDASFGIYFNERFTCQPLICYDESIVEAVCGHTGTNNLLFILYPQFISSLYNL